MTAPHTLRQRLAVHIAPTAADQVAAALESPDTLRAMQVLVANGIPPIAELGRPNGVVDGMRLSDTVKTILGKAVRDALIKEFDFVTIGAKTIPRPNAFVTGMCFAARHRRAA